MSSKELWIVNYVIFKHSMFNEAKCWRPSPNCWGQTAEANYKTEAKFLPQGQFASRP